MNQIVKLRTVGNSTVITIPNANLITANKKSGDEFEVHNFGEGGFLITPIKEKKKLKGEIFLEEYYGKPIEEIGMVGSDHELNWGEPVGEEIW